MLSALIKPLITTLSEDAAAQFSAGYLYGVTSKDKRDYIVGCFNNNDELNEKIDRAISDEGRGDMDAALSEWNEAK